MFHVRLDSILLLPMKSLAWPCDGRDAKMTLDCLSYAARKILYPKVRWVSQWNKYNSRALPTNYTIVPERRDETATRDQRKKMNIAMVKLISEAANNKKNKKRKKLVIYSHSVRVCSCGDRLTAPTVVPQPCAIHSLRYGQVKGTSVRILNVS